MIRQERKTVIPLTFIKDDLFFFLSRRLQADWFAKFRTHHVELHYATRQIQPNYGVPILEERPTRYLALRLQPHLLPNQVPLPPLWPRRHALLKRLVCSGISTARGNTAPPSQSHFISLAFNPPARTALASWSSVVATPTAALAGPATLI